MEATPVFDLLDDSRKAFIQSGKVQGASEMQKKILEILKERKRIDETLLTKIRDLKCY